MKKVKITAIIPTFNEELDIQRALDSVSFADEVIVIDSYSTDRTIEIVKNSSAKLIQRRFDNFSSQKNYAISKASYEWIFLLDADETVPIKLKEELINIVNSDTVYDAFFIYRSYFFKNKRLRFSGWQRDKVIRLFKKSTCRYKGKVHEEITTTGKIGFLKEKLNHYSYKNYFRYKNKLRKYAKLQAEELMVQGKIITPYHLFIKPFVRFFIQYVIQLGFLDGVNGFVISWLHAFGVWRRYVEVLNLKYSSVAKIKKNPIEKFNSSLSEKDISIIIVNYKSWKHLSLCLKAFETMREDEFSFELIVVDNKSNDGKLKEFTKKFPFVKFIENTGNNGFANACNLGALNAVGNNLLFLNPDTIANKEAIALMLKTAKSNSNYGIISCNQINDNGKVEKQDRVFLQLFTLFGFFRIFFRSLSKKTKENKEFIFTDWVSGSVVFISRGWFQKVDGWNEDYWMYYEDVDLSKKVSDAGGKVVLLKNTSILHNHGGASRINFKTATITKTEVLISKHVYIHNHFRGVLKFTMLLWLIIVTLFFKSITAILGMLFFFVPKLKLGMYLFIAMIRYYYHCLKKGTWLSSRSMNLPYKG
ncbi:MAG: glycosyltransferase [Flavobacteriaceae bacterium]|nr:glycosyltransferase [Flavobacteriaceae bacterium]